MKTSDTNPMIELTNTEIAELREQFLVAVAKLEAAQLDVAVSVVHALDAFVEPAQIKAPQQPEKVIDLLSAANDPDTGSGEPRKP